MPVILVLLQVGWNYNHEACFINASSWGSVVDVWAGWGRCGGWWVYTLGLLEHGMGVYYCYYDIYNLRGSTNSSCIFIGATQYKVRYHRNWPPPWAPRDA